MRLSAYILCRDSEATIERCLSSVNFADEIICIIDTRSKDSTDLICLHYTPHVYHFEWANDSFADARNFALTKCTGDLIMPIDSDEVCENFQIPLDDCDVYFCTVIKDGHTFPDIRLHKNNIGIQYMNDRHNEIIPGNYKEGKSPIIMRGITTTSPEEAKKKTQELLEKHLECLTTEPDNHGLCYHISMCYRALEDWPNCISWARFALDKPINDPHKAQACINLYLGYNALGKPYTAAWWLNMSLSYCPAQLTAKALLYEQMQHENNIELAEIFKRDILDTKESLLPLDITKENINQIFIN